MPRLNKPEDKFLDFNRAPNIYFRMNVKGAEGAEVIYQSLGRIDVETARRVRDALVATLNGAVTCAKLGLTLPQNELADQFGVQGVFKRLGLLTHRRKLATIGELIEAFELDAPGRDIKPKTVSAAASSLRLVVREVLGIEGVSVDIFPSSVLKWTLLQDFQARRVAAAVPAGPAAVQTARITAASTISQARMVVAEPAMREAAMRELLLPDLEEFRTWQPAASTRKVRVPVDDVTIERLRAEVDALWFAGAEGDQAAIARYLAVALAGNVGLRRGDAKRARWSWVRVVGGKPTLYNVATDEAEPKGNEYSVTIEGSVWKDMQALRGKGAAYIVPGDTIEARDAVFDGTAKWLRGLAPALDVDKPNHELRAVFLQAMDRAHGRQAASAAAGHDKARTTEIYTGKGGGTNSVRAL